MNIAIVGATGNVGREMLSIILKRFDKKNIFPIASSRSEGMKVSYGNDEISVESLEKFDLNKIQFIYLDLLNWAPKFAKAGCVVIDNSSHFRMDPDVPLIIPEVNEEAQKLKKTIK